MTTDERTPPARWPRDRHRRAGVRFGDLASVLGPRVATLELPV